ncbi:MAG: phage tail protein [Mycobacterium leprae]
MAVLRDRPYSQFNFLVDLGTGDTVTAVAGFQEISGLGMEITTAEYRTGNDPNNSPMKINTLYKVPDVTLKRGVIGALDLFTWLKQVREGNQKSLRTVTISLQNEEHSATVLRWKLSNARPIKYTGPSLSGKGSELAIEELVLSCERIDLE